MNGYLPYMMTVFYENKWQTRESYLNRIMVRVQEQEQEHTAKIVRVCIRVSQLIGDSVEKQIATWNDNS